MDAEMIDSELVELDFEQLDRDMQHLSHVQKQEVLVAKAFGDFPAKTTAKYAYLTRKMDEGPKVKSIPAGVIAGSLGYSYESKQQRNNFKSDILDKHPDFNDQWVSLKKVSVQFQTLPNSENGDIVFPIPGEDKTYVIGANDHGGTKYIFMTPIFARFLLSRADDRLHAFFHKVHDEVRKMVKGESNIFTGSTPTAMEVEATPVVPELSDVERQVAIRNMEMELEMKAAEVKIKVAEAERMQLDVQKDKFDWHIATFEKLGGLDGRSRVFLRDHIFNAGAFTNQNTGSNLLKDVDKPREIEISSECRKLGRRHTKHDIQMIGTLLSNMYKAKYGDRAPFGKKYANGGERDVRIYLEKDLDLMHEAIEKHYATSDAEAAKAVDREKAGNLFAFGFSSKNQE